MIVTQYTINIMKKYLKVGIKKPTFFITTTGNVMELAVIILEGVSHYYVNILLYITVLWVVQIKDRIEIVLTTEFCPYVA